MCTLYTACVVLEGVSRNLVLIKCVLDKTLIDCKGFVLDRLPGKAFSMFPYF